MKIFLRTSLLVQKWRYIKNNRSHSTSVLQLQWAVCIFMKPYERSIPRCLFASTHLCSFVRAPYSMTPDQKGRWSDFASRPRKISSRVCNVAGILNDLIRKWWACKQANEWVRVKVGLELKPELKPAFRMTAWSEQVCVFAYWAISDWTFSANNCEFSFSYNKMAKL